MGLFVTVTKAEAPDPIPEGLYRASVSKIEEHTGLYGAYLRFVFEIADGDHKGETRSLVASKKLTSSANGNSKLFDVVKTLNKTEPEVDESVDLDSLVGKSCQIVVKNGKFRDGVQFQDVSQVLPA